MKTKLSLEAFKASVSKNEKSLSNFSNANVLQGSLAKITGGLLGACHY